MKFNNISYATKFFIKLITILFFILFLNQHLIENTFAMTTEDFSENFNNLNNKTKVKVGFIPDGNFYDVDINGDLTGYNYDYLMKVSQFTNWYYEFVIIEEDNLTDSYVKAMDMLTNGEIDLIGSQEKTPQNLEVFEFGEQHYGVVKTTLSALANNNDVTINNFFMSTNLRAALVENSDTANKLFSDIMSRYGINPIITYVENRDDAVNLLLEEQVDVIMNTDFSIYHNTLSILYSDNPTPMYFVSKKGNTSLIKELDNAIVKLNLTSSSYLEQLKEKYFATGHKGALVRTSAENIALENIDYLTVGLLKNLEPYQFFESDKLGITVDILNSISEIIDLPFKYVWFDDYNDLARSIAEQNVDIFATLPFNYNLINVFDIYLSDPYLTNGAVWLYNSDGRTALNYKAYNYFVTDNVPFYYAQDIKYVFDPLPIMTEISNTGSSVLFSDPYIAQYYLQKEGITNIDMQGLSNVHTEICMGVGKHVDPVILGLLNHSILHLDPYYVEEIIHQNTIVNEEVNLSTFFELYSSNIINGLLVVFLIVALILCFYTLKFRRLSRQDSLTKLTNAGYFHSYCEQKTHKLENGCLILIDIDNFKQINDNNGHNVGDEIIKLVSKILQNRFRQNDIVGRLGGDEFVILIENSTSLEDLNNRASLILTDLKEQSGDVNATLSMGGVLFTKPVFYNNLYRLTDEVLYSVKKRGRNGFEFKVFGSDESEDDDFNLNEQKNINQIKED